MPITSERTIGSRRRAGIRRRTLLCAVPPAVVGCAFPFLATAAPATDLAPAANQRRFTVLYRGKRIGSHVVLHSTATGDTRVSTEIHLLVKVAFFTAFMFSHRSEEVWRGGRLKSLASETVEHGETLHVEGVATSEGFRVMSKGGPCIAPGASLTSNSLWTPEVLGQQTVIDAQHGGIIGVSARRFADEELAVGGRRVAVTRYTFITPYLAGSIWYDAQDLWIRGQFERDGATIEYQLDT